MERLPAPQRAMSSHPTTTPRQHRTQYEKMLRSQGGGCAICCNPESLRDVDGTPLKLCLYYSSQGPGAGMVRGLICRACFTALLFLRDSPALLARAIAFLTAQPRGRGVLHTGSLRLTDAADEGDG